MSDRDDNVEAVLDDEITCAGSVGPRSWEESKERDMDRPPFNFRPEDFDVDDERR